MVEGKGRDDRDDMGRRDFLAKSGLTLVAVGAAAHVASGAERGQEAAVYPPLRQTDLQDYMLKAEIAMSRISKGIYGGLLDEVAAGAEDLEKVLKNIEQANVVQVTERQADWKKSSVEAADNARNLHRIAAAAQQKGEKEISAEVVQLYSTAMRAATACHSAFRVRA
jgi:hypothetical protein